jgi:hypothetical protein
VHGIWSNGAAQLLAFRGRCWSKSQHVASRVAQGQDGYLYVGEGLLSLRYTSQDTAGRIRRHLPPVQKVAD